MGARYSVPTGRSLNRPSQAAVTIPALKEKLLKHPFTKEFLERLSIHMEEKGDRKNTAHLTLTPLENDGTTKTTRNLLTFWIPQTLQSLVSGVNL